MMLGRLLCVLICLLIFSSCARSHLSIRNQYLDHSYLASCRIGTPDPLKCAAFCGQQLIIHWRLSKEAATRPDLHLRLHLLYRNFTSETVAIPIRRPRGFYTYRLINQCYWEKRGILTYRLQLCSGDEVLESWTHQLWTQLIDLGPQPSGVSPCP
jgi:hypothetical protein